MRNASQRPASRSRAARTANAPIKPDVAACLNLSGLVQGSSFAGIGEHAQSVATTKSKDVKLSALVAGIQLLHLCGEVCQDAFAAQF